MLSWHQYQLDLEEYKKQEAQYQLDLEDYNKKLGEYNQKYADWKVAVDSAIDYVNKEIAGSSQSVTAAVMA